MEVTINAQSVITAAAVITAIGVIGGIAAQGFRFIERDKKHSRDITAMRREQTLICFGVLACLKGLKEQGCDGPVTDALSKLEEHLNQAAHDGI